MRPKITAILTFVLLLVAGACGTGSEGEDSAGPEGKSDSASTTQEVVIKDFAFAPDRITIARGSTVHWRNDDQFLHTVTSGATSGAENQADGRFDLELPEQGSDVSFTFDETGTFTYFCRQHNAMDGTITVS